MNKVKMILFAVLILCGMAIGPKQVKAADGDIKIEIYKNSDEDSYRKYYYYKNMQDNSFDELEGVSYDYKKQELTLNNCRVSGLSINVYNMDFEDFSIVLKGNSIIRTQGIDRPIRVYKDSSANAKKTNVVIKGDGKLYLYWDYTDLFPSRNYIENKYGDVVIDGPTVVMPQYDCGYYYNPAIVSNGFIMKSGKLDVTVYPYIKEESNNKVRYFYNSVIRAKEKIDILDGEFNVTYKYFKNDDKDVIINWVDYVVLDIYGYEPKGTDKVNLSVADELKEYVKVKKNYGLRFRILLEDGESVKEYDDPSCIDGLTWDAKSKILTMDNFECIWLEIKSENMHEKITINVKNKNVFHSKAYGIVIEDLDLTLIGDGSIKMTGGITASVRYYVAARTGDDGKARLVVDGPYLEIDDSYMYFDRFELKSGRIDMTVDWYKDVWVSDSLSLIRRSAIVVREGLIISGGTMYVKMDKIPKEYEDYDSLKLYPVIGVVGRDEYEDDHVIPEVIFEDCNVIFVDKYGAREEFIDYYYRINKEFEMTKSENVDFKYATDESEIKKISIDNYDVKVLINPCYYNGKPKTPKVQLGTLVEGVDYEVTYENNIEIGKAKAHINGIGLYTGKKTVEFDIIDKNGVVKPKKENASNSSNDDINSIFTDRNFKYRIISESSANAKYGKVEVVGLVNKNHKKVKIKNTVAFADKKYKITSIAKKAFKNNKKIKSVVIGKNVTKIGSKAFYNCKKLNKVVIKSKKLKKVGKKAFFKKGKEKVKFVVPKNIKKAYKKLFKF